MVIDEDYPSFSPVKQLWSLLHRNMSLILQRGGKREDKIYMKQLLNLDIAYAQAVRLGAEKIVGESKRDSVFEEADEIEIKAKQKLLALGKYKLTF